VPVALASSRQGCLRYGLKRDKLILRRASQLVSNGASSHLGHRPLRAPLLLVEKAQDSSYDEESDHVDPTPAPAEVIRESF